MGDRGFNILSFHAQQFQPSRPYQGRLYFPDLEEMTNLERGDLGFPFILLEIGPNNGLPISA